MRERRKYERGKNMRGSWVKIIYLGVDIERECREEVK